MVRSETPETAWPRIDRLIEWADDGHYEYRRRKRKLSRGDFNVRDLGDRFLVTDVNGDQQFVPKTEIIDSDWEAIDFVIADRRRDKRYTE